MTLNVFYLAEKGEMSCLSLAQLMVGGGTLWASHGKMASSPSITDILIGSAAPPGPSTLDLGRTGRTYMGRQTRRDQFKVYMTVLDEKPKDADKKLNLKQTIKNERQRGNLHSFIPHSHNTYIKSHNMLPPYQVGINKT